MFFGLVMAAVLAIGWHWFDRDPDAAWFDPAKLQAPPRATTDGWTAAGGVIGIAIAAFALASAVTNRADALPAQLDLPEVPGWHRVLPTGGTPWEPYYPAADHLLTGRYADGNGARIDLAVAVYAGQREGRELVGFGQGVLRENDRWVRVDDEAPIAGGSVMRITAAGPIEREVATWYVLRGAVTSDARTVKVMGLKAKILGGPQRAVAIHISAERDGADARAAIARFVAAAGPLDRLADRITAGR